MLKMLWLCWVEGTIEVPGFVYRKCTKLTFEPHPHGVTINATIRDASVTFFPAGAPRRFFRFFSSLLSIEAYIKKENTVVQRF